MNRLRIRTDGDIFGDDTEMCAGFREATFKIGFAGKLVLEHVQIGHAKSVETRGFEESVIPVERGKALSGAFAIQSFEELALGIVALELRARACRKEKKKYGGEEKF